MNTNAESRSSVRSSKSSTTLKSSSDEMSTEFFSALESFRASTSSRQIRSSNDTDSDSGGDYLNCNGGDADMGEAIPCHFHRVMSTVPGYSGDDEASSNDDDEDEDSLDPAIINHAPTTQNVVSDFYASLSMSQHLPPKNTIAVQPPPSPPSASVQLVQEPWYDSLILGQMLLVLRNATGSDLPDATVSNKYLRRRIQEFEYAQNQRTSKFQTKPYGIAGMYTNLSDIRMDLRWAEDTAWRRERSLPYVRWADYEEARLNGFVRPYFSYGLVLCNTAMMVYTFYLNDWEIEALEVNPLIGPSTETLIKAGALQSILIIENGELYRLVSAIFLHGGLVHLFANMGALWLIGRAVERNHGSLITFVLYMVSALGANVLSVLMQPGYILVGASGAIFGLIGVCMADIVLNWKLLFHVFRQREDYTCLLGFYSILWIYFDLALNSMLGWTPYVDNFAHLGGLLYGFLMASTFLKRLPLKFFGQQSGKFYQFRIRLLRLIGVFSTFALLLSSSFSLSQSDGVTSPCWSCRFISCAPFPFWTEQKWWHCDGCEAISASAILDESNVFFLQVDLSCPQGNLEFIDVTPDRFSQQSDLVKELPKLCRKHCFSDDE